MNSWILRKSIRKRVTGWIGILMVGWTAGAIEFEFSVSVHGLGTKKLTQEKLADGKPFAFPVDDFDLAKRLRPAIEDFRKTRAEAAPREAASALEQAKDDGFRAVLLGLVREILDAEKQSRGFYPTYDRAVKEIEQIAAFWQVHSRDVSSVKIWNNALQAEITDREGRAKCFEGFTLKSTPSGDDTVFTVTPLIFESEKGIGMVNFRRSIRHDPALRLDIPINARPGQAVEVYEKEGRLFLARYEKLLALHATQILPNDLKLYLAESVLRTEVNTGWFDEKSIPPEIPNALARLALARHLIKPEGAMHEEIFRTFGLIDPASADLDELADALGDLRWDAVPPDTVSTEVRRAWTYFWASALLRASLEHDEGKAEKWWFFRQLPPVDVEKFSRAADFFAVAKTHVPDIADRFSAARQAQLDVLAKERIRRKPADKPKPKPRPDSPPPAHYQTTDFDGLTVRYPESLAEAVAKAAPGWRVAIEENRARFEKTLADRPWPEIQRLTEEERRRFKDDFGLKIPPKEKPDAWAESMTMLSETDRLFSLAFSDRLDIWIKEDILEILGDGGKIADFSTADGKTVTYSVSFGEQLSALSYAEMKAPGAIAGLPKIPIPVVMKLDEIAGKPTDELIELLENDPFFGAIISEDVEVEELAGILNIAFARLDDEFRFSVLVHEVAESLIVENLIASPDRRWFADGMANFIALEFSKTRFGEEAFPIPEVERADLLKNLDLFGWEASETENEKGQGDPTSLSNARYFFATKAIEKAVAGRGDDFAKRWLIEIGKARWNRANSQTVIDAYAKLTDGADLREIVETIGTVDE